MMDIEEYLFPALPEDLNTALNTAHIENLHWTIHNHL